jgi:hypothetical protein
MDDGRDVEIRIRGGRFVDPLASSSTASPAASK